LRRRAAGRAGDRPHAGRRRIHVRGAAERYGPRDNPAGREPGSWRGRVTIHAGRSRGRTRGGAMPTTPRRRFTLVDAVVLVAATAVGIAGGRTIWDDPLSLGYTGWHRRPEMGWSARQVLMRVPHGLLGLLPGLAAWTLTLLALRFRQPRPTPARLAT